jgi:hypothetical protein
MADIGGLLRELKGLQVEIERLKGLLKDLNKKENNVENQIRAYLREVGQPGVRSGRLIVLLDTKTKRERKKEKDKEKDACRDLRKKGGCRTDKEAKKMYNIVRDAMKGEEGIKDELTIHQTRY